MAKNCQPVSVTTHEEMAMTAAMARKYGALRVTAYALASGPQIRRGEQQPHACHRVARDRFSRFPGGSLDITHSYPAAAPDQDHEPAADQDEQSHGQHQTFRSESLRHHLRKETGENPSRDGPATYHPEHSLGLARCKDVICQSPDLRGREHAEDFYPYIERREDPDRTGVITGQHPEQRPSGGEEYHATNEQIAKENSPCNKQVACYNRRHHYGAGNVDIGELSRLEPREK